MRTRYDEVATVTRGWTREESIRWSDSFLGETQARNALSQDISYLLPNLESHEQKTNRSEPEDLDSGFLVLGVDGETKNQAWIGALSRVWNIHNRVMKLQSDFELPLCTCATIASQGAHARHQFPGSNQRSASSLQSAFGGLSLTD